MLASGPAADAAPGQPGHQLLGSFTRDWIPGAGAVPRGALGHADQADAQQVRLVTGEPGVLPDRPAHRFGALALDFLEALTNGGLVAQVRLEHQPVGLALAPHILEVRA